MAIGTNLHHELNTLNSSLELGACLDKSNIANAAHSAVPDTLAE